MQEIGSVIDGKYRILSEIGHGGMSVVYMAINEKANKTWAIKEVRRGGVVDYDEVKQGLIVETEMLKKLHHPHLPSIIDVIDEEDSFLIVMDYIEGHHLGKSLEEYGAQPQELVIDWAKQLCDVLGYLHSRKPPIIYRDMKPSNVMLKPDGNLMLIDFGTAREFKERNLADTTCLGTVGYAAPEQFGGRGQTDARTDIYCLGTTLYHLVTGKNPCEPPYELLPIRQINPNLSDGLQQIISKCTQKNPDDRYQSCAELMYALEHYGEMDGRYRRKQKRKLFAFAASSVLTFAFLGTSLWGYLSAEQKKSENYQVILTRASDATLTEEESISYYLSAIATQPEDTRAYLELVERMLLEDGLSKTEAAVFTQLQAGVDETNMAGYSSTIYPLERLKASNPSGYAQVCYEIGNAYWYDYEVESERSIIASDWFAESKDYNETAGIYCEIGECQQQIKKYAGQERTQKMYETYGQLWQKLAQLAEAVKQEEDETKLLVWPEVVSSISDKAQYFLKTASKDDLYRVLDDIEEQSGKLAKQTEFTEIRQSIEHLTTQIEDTRARIATGNEREA